MADGLEFLSQNAHTGNRIVQIIGGLEHRGFLLTYDGPADARTYHAFYNDGLVEQINPIDGYPRPIPDPAVRTKSVRVPGSLRSGDIDSYTLGSMFSGQMRRVVQCEFSRGNDATKFSYTWSKTHGILEFPYPRVIGGDPAAEALNAQYRKFWLIEISAAGLFAAPLSNGKDCLHCCVDASQYLPTGSAQVSLAWAFDNHNEAGLVQRVLTAAQMAPLYSIYGAPWYEGMGWAFSYSGRKASNVLAKSHTDGSDTSSFPDYYETRLIDLGIDATFLSRPGLTIQIVSAGVARASLFEHGISEGGFAVISGAEQPEYNGAHAVFNVTSTQFDFRVIGSPPSPATGALTLANAADPATITAVPTIGTPGKVTFRRGAQGTLWVPHTTHLWDGIFPFFNTVQATGPVHVFYDGEEQVLTSWGLTVEAVAGEASPGITPNGTTSQFGSPQIDWDPIVFVAADQNPPSCTYPSQKGSPGFRFNYGPYTKTSWGFFGPFDLQTENYQQSKAEAQTSELGRGDISWYWSDRYTYCGGGSLEELSGIYSVSTYAEWVSALTQKTKVVSGTSALILFRTDREAVAGLKIKSETDNGGTWYVGPFIVGVHGHSESTNNAPHFTTTDIDGAQVVGGPPEPLKYGTVWRDFINSFAVPKPASFLFNTASGSGTFSMRASGNVTYESSFDSAAIPAIFADFVHWTATKQTAESDLLFMRGGLFYNDPNLSPADQRKNYLLKAEAAAPILKTGFTPLGGKFAVGFIGQV